MYNKGLYNRNVVLLDLHLDVDNIQLIYAYVNCI
jgi:hypothetical protein